MKNVKTVPGLLLFLLIFNSCKKETLPKNDLLPQREKEQSGKDVTVLRPGDGAYDALGWGYDATKEFANANSVGFQVIDLAAFMASNPTRVVEEFPNSQVYNEDYGADARAYSFALSSTINNTAGLPIFKKTLEAGFSSSLTASGKFDGKYIWASYNLTIRQRRVRFNSDPASLQNYVTTDFVNDVNSYYTNPQILVQKYGTHVLVDIYTGAKLNLMYQSETRNSDRTYAARIGITAGVKDIFNMNIQNGINLADSVSNYNRKLYYATRGGNPAMGLVGTLNLGQNNPTLNIANWQSSCTPANAVLVDIGQLGLVYMYDLISDPLKRSVVKAYVDQYLINNQTYVDHLSVPIYRFVSPGSSAHAYSTSAAIPPGWLSEGIEFNAYSYTVPNTVPIYHYFNPSKDDHFYSKSSATPPGYSAQGIAFYAYPAQSTGTVPIYRWYNSKRGLHFYSKSGIQPAGYSSEGIEFYAF